MHIYQNLNDGSKRILLSRSLYVMILLIINIYCLIIIGLNLYIWLPIGVMVCNFISIIIALGHIWFIIFYNIL